MRKMLLAALLGSTAVIAAAAHAQTNTPSGAATGPADLCRELLAYADKKAAEPPKNAAGQAPSSAAAPIARTDQRSSGTQGGGSVGPSTSTDTSSQESAPPTTPVTPGTAEAAASSPHATDSSNEQTGASPAGSAEGPTAFRLAGGVTVQQVRDTVKGGDRQACREMAQTLRRAGADMPAALMALAAYEPDPAKRQ